MHEQIYYEHWNLGAHATSNAINMAVLSLFKEKRFACIEHICIYLLRTCDNSFYVGAGGGDMKLMKHHLTCNVFGKVYI